MGVRNHSVYDSSKIAWQLCPLIIAWRHFELGEDVFLIDVNQSVPEKILEKAIQLVHKKANYRRIAETLSDPSATVNSKITTELLEALYVTKTRDLAERNKSDMKVQFIGEELWDFDIDSDVVSAVVGPLVFSVSAHTHNSAVFLQSLELHLKRLEARRHSNLFLAGVSNHDTMPPLPEYSPLLYLLYFFLPGAIPLVFSGNEYHAQMIVNKELGFNTSDELRQMRKLFLCENLALFNDQPLDWRGLPREDSIGRPVVDMFSLLQTLKTYREKMVFESLDGYRVIAFLANEASFKSIGYQRFNTSKEGNSIYVITNLNSELTFVWPYENARIITQINVASLGVSATIKCGKEITFPRFSGVLLATGELQNTLSAI